MKIPSYFLAGDIDSLLNTCDELLSFAEKRLRRLEEPAGNVGLDALEKQEEEAMQMALVLIEIRERLTDSELQEAVAQLYPSTPSFGGTFYDWEDEQVSEYEKAEERKKQEVLHRYVHTDKAEMRTAKKIEEEVDKLLATNKILSERLCAKLREIQDKINLRLEQNDKMVDAEAKEKRIAAKEVLERQEAELLQTKKNAAW